MQQDQGGGVREEEARQEFNTFTGGDEHAQESQCQRATSAHTHMLYGIAMGRERERGLVYHRDSS